MPKKNALIAQIEAKYEAKFRMRVDMLLQMGQDAAMMAAHDTPSINMGPGRAKEFCLNYIEAMNQMAQLVVDDAKSDKEIVYAKAKIDEKIKSIVGEENFVPWDGRYGGKHGN